MILEPKKIKSVTVSIVSHVFAMNDRTRCYDLSFLKVVFKPAFSLSSFIFIKRLFDEENSLSGSFLLSAIRVVSSAYLRLLILDRKSTRLNSSHNA